MARKQQTVKELVKRIKDLEEQLRRLEVSYRIPPLTVTCRQGTNDQLEVEYQGDGFTTIIVQQGGDTAGVLLNSDDVLEIVDYLNRLPIGAEE